MTLLSNVAHNVRDGVGLVLEMTVCHVGEAGGRVSLGSRGGADRQAVGLALLFLSLIITLLDLLGQIIWLGERLDEMLHVVALTTNEAAKVQDNPASLVTLSEDGDVGVLELRQLLLVALALTLKLLSNLLLEDKSLESVVTLLLSASKTDRQAGVVVLLLVNEAGKTAVLPLVGLNLDLEILGLLGELLSKGLELEELLLPALKLLHQVVVALGDLVELGVHATLEVDEVLPRLESISRVLVPLTDNLVEMTHRNLGHEGLLDRAAKHSLEASVATKLLADMVHDSHDCILVPPLRVLDRLNLAAHDNDLAGRDKLATTIGRSKVLGNAGRSDVAVQSLGESGNELVALTGSQGSGWAGSQNKVAIKINNQGISGRREERAALNSDTKDVGARLLNKLLGMAGVNNGNVETAPLVNSNTVSNSLGSHGEHGRVVADKDDSASGRDGSLNDTNDVGNRQTVEQGPHGEVLEPCGRRRELVAESIVLHVDAHKIVEAGSWEAQDARDLLGMEQVGGLVPVNPHASQIISQEVVERITRQERQAVGDPVRLIRVVVVVALGPLAKVADGLGSLLIGSRPHSQADSVECVRRILLKNEGVMNAVRLASACANLDIVREAGLLNKESMVSEYGFQAGARVTYPHGGMKRTRNFIVLLKARAATQNLW